MHGASVEKVIVNLGAIAHMLEVVWGQWFFGRGKLQTPNCVDVKKQSTHPTVTEVTVIFQVLLSKE